MELKILKDKKILFISVQTFNYEKAIADKLRSLGAEVDYYDERPTNSIFVKGIIRLRRSLYQNTINKYYNRILAQIVDGNYDYLFVIKGEVIPAFFLEEFRKRNLKCEFIFYTWDSFNNNPHGQSILKYFDKKFTFDNFDANTFNLSFRPLFFIDEYDELNGAKSEVIKQDLLFLGTAHSDRYKISSEAVGWCNENNLKAYAYYFMPSRLVFIFKSIFDPSFKGFEYRKLSFSSLSILDIIALYKQSSVILDVNHPGQKGLTMRTFEALGAGKKLITTNPDIKKYLFYNEKNIFIIDRKNIVLEKSFFETPFVPINEELRNAMSLTGWLKMLFVETKENYWIANIK
ncbi:hypothetical protein [Flavobacterium sp. WC2429]|uniref:Lipopolysaccharide biosynthesis protein n=1 Tax=Flavobacterium sp. WC2429 TaxID=3234140 RepID=A0AB39WMW2_9FLAO